MSGLQTVVSNPKKQLASLVALKRVTLKHEQKGPRISPPAFSENVNVTLTPDQSSAFETIRPYLGQHRAFLLEGITGSGKTQVYLEAMRKVVAKGQSVLFIVPEIALTPQLLSRVQQAVGEEQAVLAWHSGVSPTQRRDNYYWLLEQTQSVIVGARSAIFAPLKNVGLIVVDEEHDASYKQDSAPRYHGRDLALFRAQKENATIILGSATPSLESLHNVQLGKLQHLSLRSRPGHAAALPKVEIIDLKARKEHSVSQFRDRATTEGHGLAILSSPLKEAIKETLNSNQQTLLFLNRRGYASFVLCETCGHVAECEHCSVSLTYHRAQDRLKCHQCGYQSAMISQCTECEADEVIPLGLGTERIENEVRLHFPNACIERLDRDVIRKPDELKQLLQRMHQGDIDILIGTQMLAKGHDFPGVTLVGVILAETGLAFPDYRASERTFQLLTQVAGRAGRRSDDGRVLIQTFNPKHVAIERAAQHDVHGFVEQEMVIRQQRNLPPFCHAALFRIEGEDLTAVEILARRVGQTIREFSREAFDEGTFNILGPAPAPLEKIKKKNRYHIWFWNKEREGRSALLRALRNNDAMYAALKKADARLIIDVDPMHVL
jgi:primosomal protein N' (replication factor Y)